MLDGADHLAVAREHQDSPQLERWCAICGQEVFATSHGWVHRHSYQPSRRPIALPACKVCGRIPASRAHLQDGRP